MGRFATDAELRAAEDALPPPTDRPPPTVVAVPGDEIYAAVGMPHAVARTMLRGMGYVADTSRAAADLHSSIPPCSVRLYTKPSAAGSVVAGIAGCRKLTPEERRLVELYHWLPAKEMRRCLPNARPQTASDVLAHEGVPWLCYAAIRFDKRGRFGSYAGVVLRRRYFRRYQEFCAANKKTVSLDALWALTDFDEPPHVPRGTPGVGTEDLEQLFAAHAPYATPRQREILTAYLGLDGANRESYAAVAARFGVSQQRVHQIVQAALYAARAYKRGTVGLRLECE